jgi:orotate phosphoribosyltransferase
MKTAPNQGNRKSNLVNWKKRLTEEGLIWRYTGQGPHAAFSLTDSHSDFYFNSDWLASNPPLLREVCEEIFAKAKEQIVTKPDWVITCPPHSLNIGFCLAELFDTKFGYIKSLQEPEIHFDLKANEYVLLCADDLISGSSLLKIFDALAPKDVKPLNPLMVIANWKSTATFKGFDVVSLIDENANIWKPTECPLCAAGSPAISARDNWRKLNSAY